MKRTTTQPCRLHCACYVARNSRQQHPKRQLACPGASEHDLLVRIVDMLGMPPGHVLAKAAHTRKYFGREEEVVSVGGVAMRQTKYRVR